MKKKKTVQPKAVKSPWLQWIAYAALLLLVFSLSFFKISGDDDVFWHLASGRNIIETHTLSGPDAFSWPEPQQKWTTNSWLWDVSTFFIWRATGYAGICFFRTLILLSVFMIWIRTLSKMKVPAWLTAVILSGAAFGMMERFDTRPHIMTFLFFSLLLTAIIRFLYLDKRELKPLLWLPLLFLIWGNFHPSLIIGSLLLLMLLASAAVMYLWPSLFKRSDIEPLTKENVRNLILITLLSVGAGLCNPVGIAPYAAIFNGADNDLLKDVYEWISPFHKFYSNSLMGIFYKLYLILGVVIVFYSIKKRDIFALITTLAFAVYSTQAVRFAADLFMVVPVLLLISLNRLLFQKKVIRPAAPALLASLLCMLAVFYVLSGRIYDRSIIHRKPGSGVNAAFYPFQLYDYIRANDIQNIGLRPFNTYECGGLFVWEFPGKKNFVDSRMASTATLRSYNMIMNKRPGFENEFKKYDPDYAILFFDGYFYPSSELILNNMRSMIASYLFDNENDWKLVYWDDRSFLFLRNNAAFSNIIEKDGYKYVTPWNYLYRKQVILDAAKNDPEGLRKELDRKKQEEPRGDISRSMFKNLDPLIR